MPANQLRGAPGLLLLGFAIVMLVIAVLGWLSRSRSTPSETPSSAALESKQAFAHARVTF